MRIRPLFLGASAALALFAAAVSFPLSAAPQEENALTSAQLSEIRQAVRAGQASVVEELIEKGASPNFRMENGDTGFTYALPAGGGSPFEVRKARPQRRQPLRRNASHDGGLQGKQRTL